MPPVTSMARQRRWLAWGRTKRLRSAALTALAKGTSLPAALADLSPSADALDHLFAALGLSLARQPGAIVERELRRAHAEGADADAIQYSLALALETQGRFREAYDLSIRLVDSPVHSTLARFDCARFAARLDKVVRRDGPSF